mmetsp:Transcript_15215/g.28944  ORF Transcript_15215/g.28944 Transcript_15215/m.28944 type:complete len:168 (-) Transcript_15215:267-770(-)
MPVKSLPADKPAIIFHGAMMAIQNFGFMIFYYDIWGSTPYDSDCQSTRDAVAMMAMTCFCVAFLCVGMAYGGYTDDSLVFAIYWFAHLVGGAAYTICTFTIPIARWSDKGKNCASLAPITGDRLELVYIFHALLYLVYVGSMLSITYFSYVKPTFFPKAEVTPDSKM